LQQDGIQQKKGFETVACRSSTVRRFTCLLNLIDDVIDDSLILGLAMMPN
jgi:hypothetical protein